MFTAVCDGWLLVILGGFSDFLVFVWCNILGWVSGVCVVWWVWRLAGFWVFSGFVFFVGLFSSLLGVVLGRLLVV